MKKKQKVWWGVLLSTGLMTATVLVVLTQWPAAYQAVQAATTDRSTDPPKGQSGGTQNNQQPASSNPQEGLATPLREDMKGLPDDTLTTQQNRDVRLAKAKHEAYLASLATLPGKTIGNFRTSLAGHNASGRVQNILLASSKLNGKVLLPGEELSFNGVLGDSNDPAGGWQLATVIVGKKFEEGYGGGICQVSSTLYNSVLQAGLGITERHTHSLPVGYVQPGQDATVSYPELDFSFVNTTHAPVRLQTTVVGDDVIATILALPPEPQE